MKTRAMLGKVSRLTQIGQLGLLKEATPATFPKCGRNNAQTYDNCQP